MPIQPKQQPPYYTPGNTPTTPKIYTALLTQTSTNAPLATIMANTIGEIVWTRTSAGIYVGTLTAAFTENKTYFTITDNLNDYKAMAFTTVDIGENYVTIETSYDYVAQDNQLSKTPIEIRVYT